MRDPNELVWFDVGINDYFWQSFIEGIRFTNANKTQMSFYLPK